MKARLSKNDTLHLHTDCGDVDITVSSLEGCDAQIEFNAVGELTLLNADLERNSTSDSDEAKSKIEEQIHPHYYKM